MFYTRIDINIVVVLENERTRELRRGSPIREGVNPEATSAKLTIRSKPKGEAEQA